MFTGLMTVAAMHEAGVPKGVLHAVTGPGETVGAALVADPRVDGLTFTGSYETGMQVFRSFATAFPKPVICEMGGKNPVIVAAAADIDAAAEGTLRSAFGLQGQKCSAASRAYVDRSVFAEFVTALVERTRAINIGNPLDRGVYLGPVIDEAAVARFEAAVDEAQRTGQVFVGGKRIIEGAAANGNYVEPTVVEVPRDSALWTTELFVPLIALTPVDSLDEAFELANATPLALTAGFFSEEPSDVDQFLERIEAGVVYINRRAARRRARGPASSRSAVGRDRAPTARPVAARTTCSNTSGNNPGRTIRGQPGHHLRIEHAMSAVPDQRAAVRSRLRERAPDRHRAARARRRGA